ncbi:MAG TPA: ferritin-like domain-containing protein [Gaiellaceae bacterium]
MTEPITTHEEQAESLTEVEVDGASGSSTLLKGALAAGTVFGALAVGPFVRQALGGSGGDLDILNFALTLEYLEADFYAKALRLDLGKDVAALAKEFGESEAQHVTALHDIVRNMGGTPVARPSFTFPMKDEKSFLKLAQTLEDTGVAAYNGAGPLLESKSLLTAAGSIVQVEARHAAAIRLQNGQTPAPDAFDKTLGKQQVLAAVKPLIAG